MKKIKLLFIAAATLIASTTVSAQETEATEASKVQFSAGADLVSSYLWRGQHIAGISFQPSLGIEFAGFSLSAWGSTDFNNIINELDWTLSYSIAGFSIGVTDYFGPYVAGETPKYFEEKSHILEATASYDFSEVCEKFPLSISWSTNFLNDFDAAGDERYSTYIELGYPVTVGDVELAFAVGLTPWDGMYSDGFNVVNISITGSKEIKITDSFSLPVFSQIGRAPF